MICQDSKFQLAHASSNLNIHSMLIDENDRNQFWLASNCSRACNDDEKKEFSEHFDNDATVMQDTLEAASWCTQSLQGVENHDEHFSLRKKQKMVLCKGNQAPEKRPNPAMLTDATNSFKSASFLLTVPPLSSPLNVLISADGKSNDSARLVHIVESHSLDGVGDGVSAAANAAKHPVSSPVNSVIAATNGTSAVISPFIAPESTMRLSDDKEKLWQCESRSQREDLSVSMMEDKDFYGTWKLAASRRKVVHLRHIAHKRALETIHKCCGTHTADK